VAVVVLQLLEMVIVVDLVEVHLEDKIKVQVVAVVVVLLDKEIVVETLLDLMTT
jgi:hypothetical protein